MSTGWTELDDPPYWLRAAQLYLGPVCRGDLIYHADPLRPPETDEEPWAPELADPEAGVGLLDGAVVATSAWLALITLTAAAFAAVLALLAARRFRWHPR